MDGTYDAYLHFDPVPYCDNATTKAGKQKPPH